MPRPNVDSAWHGFQIRRQIGVIRETYVMTNDERTVPGGAIATAVSMVELLNESGDGQPDTSAVEQVLAAVDRWGIPTVTEAFSIVIYALLNLIQPAPSEEEDALHLIVPALIAKLRKLELEEVPPEALPTLAGVFTAACLGQDPFAWRTALGPLRQGEPLSWCYAAWLLADLIDHAVLHEPGGSTKILRQIVSSNSE